MSREVSDIGPVVVNSKNFVTVGTTPVRVSPNNTGVFEAVFVATQNAYIVFGPDAAMDVADSTVWPLLANVPQTFRLGRPTAFFSVARNTVDGVLKYYIVGQTE